MVRKGWWQEQEAERLHVDHTGSKKCNQEVGEGQCVLNIHLPHYVVLKYFLWAEGVVQCWSACLARARLWLRSSTGKKSRKQNRIITKFNKTKVLPLLQRNTFLFFELFFPFSPPCDNYQYLLGMFQTSGILWSITHCDYLL